MYPFLKRFQGQVMAIIETENDAEIGAFRMVWVEGIRVGRPDGAFVCEGPTHRVPALPACRSSVLGSAPARWVSLW